MENIKVTIIQNTPNGQRRLSFSGQLIEEGKWSTDDILAALLSTEVRANGVSASEQLPAVRVHIEYY